MNEYTKGKWRLDTCDTREGKPTRRVYVEVDGKQELMLTVHYPSTYTFSNGGAQRVSNARLACAAPEMLKALLMARKALADLGTPEQKKQIEDAITHATVKSKNETEPTYFGLG